VVTVLSDKTGRPQRERSTMEQISPRAITATYYPLTRMRDISGSRAAPRSKYEVVAREYIFYLADAGPIYGHIICSSWYRRSHCEAARRISNAPLFSCRTFSEKIAFCKKRYVLRKLVSYILSLKFLLTCNLNRQYIKYHIIIIFINWCPYRYRTCRLPCL